MEGSRTVIVGVKVDAGRLGSGDCGLVVPYFLGIIIVTVGSPVCELRVDRKVPIPVVGNGS